VAEQLQSVTVTVVSTVYGEPARGGLPEPAGAETEEPEPEPGYPEGETAGVDSGTGTDETGTEEAGTEEAGTEETGIVE
jgi:hypothetical protein